MLTIFLTAALSIYLIIFAVNVLLGAFGYFARASIELDDNIFFGRAIFADRGAPARAVALESLYSVLFILFKIIFLPSSFFREPIDEEDISEPYERETLIILTHGLMGTAEHMYILQARLIMAGFKNVTLFQYRANQLRSSNLGAGLVEFARRQKLARKSPDVILIGHSLGGLISIDCADELYREIPTLGVITLGAPFHGSTLAAFGISRIARSLRPENIISFFSLRDRSYPIVSIYSRYDQFVTPYVNARFESATSENIEVAHLGHSGLIFDRRVFKALLKSIRKLRPDENRQAR